MSERAKKDITGAKTLIGQASGDGDVKSILVEPDVRGLRTAAFVWDTDTLSNIRMTQPISDISDLENISKGAYYLSTRYDWDVSENPIYIGKNISLNASVSGTDWDIMKYTYDANNNPIYVQGPVAGQWSDRVNLGW